MGRSSISVRGLAAIAAACALFCVVAASASAAPLVWTASWAEESVSTFDSVTGKEVGSPIPVGKQPSWIAITPDGTRAVVVTYNGNSAEVVDTTTRKVVKSIPIGSNGEGVAISPDGKTAYVTSESGEEVHVINVETATAGTGIHVGPVEAVAFTPDGSQAYVGVFPEEIVTIDTATKKVVGNPIDVGGNPEAIAFTPDGATAYVAVAGVKGVEVIDTALRQVVKTIATTEEPSSVAVGPDGKRLYISNASAGAIGIADTATGAIVGKAIIVPAGVGELAVTPDGKTAWVTGSALTPINLGTEVAKTPIATGEVEALAITPDQSPTAAFTAPGATVGTPAIFSGAASTDPDGSVVAWNWALGDGGTATGVSATHTYLAAGTYGATLSVVDNEGCGEAQVFTGRTAYCSGNVGASVTHSVTVTLPVGPIVAPAPSNRLTFGRIVHNRRNGTVRIQVKLPSAGFVLLFGPKVHAVTRKSKGPQSMWLTLHARVRLAKRLKKTLRAPVKFRVTFTPNGGTAKTVHRSVTLRRAPRHKHGRH